MDFNTIQLFLLLWYWTTWRWLWWVEAS